MSKINELKPPRFLSDYDIEQMGGEEAVNEIRRVVRAGRAEFLRERARRRRSSI